jgi:polyisoprenoid-binding protein YceI
MKSFYCFIFFVLHLACAAQDIFELKSGKIGFVSEAPLELIKAETDQYDMLIDTAASTFAVKIPVKSFDGFNSPLQQQHFYENYMETDKFPHAIFTGKILNDISFREVAFDVKIKGKLNIHGQEQSRIITVKCEWIERDQLRLQSTFTVALQDHNIDIPRVVYQKIAEVINVKVSGRLSPKE